MKRVFVAGHRGMVGSAITRRLQAVGWQGGPCELLQVERGELDLCRQAEVERWFAAQRPDVVILAAAKVGGIHANNSYPADFIVQNLQMQTNIIESSWRYDAEQLLFLGSSCIYPKLAPQPMPEAALLDGLLEPTNEPYAVAKIAGIKLCESFNRQHGTDFRSLMPTNLYGPGDNFHPENSHVLPALIRRFHEATQAGEGAVTVWGTGEPRREFLHVDDLAEAALHTLSLPAERYREMTSPMQSHLNVGTGEDIRIGDLARLVAQVTGFGGEIRFDVSKPDGTPRKLLNVEKLQALGWSAKIALREGLADTYAWYRDNVATARGQAAGAKEQDD